MFNYLVPTDPDWQKKDIDDKRMEERSILRDSPNMNISNEQKKKILELKLSCLLNIGQCYLQLLEFRTCIQACDMALTINKQNVKALYMRSQAKITPAGSGMVEHQQALEDLKLAYKLAPTNKTIAFAYTKLKQTLSNQLKKDKKTFNGLFKRGKLDIDNEDNSIKREMEKKDEEKNQMTWEEGLAKIKDAEMVAQQLVSEIAVSVFDINVIS